MTVTATMPSLALSGEIKDYALNQKWDSLSEAELSYYIRECALNSRQGQKKIYAAFYGFAISICNRYTNNNDDSIEILNDGFLKIFKQIHHFTPAYTDAVSSFKGWLRKIMIRTAIDYFRKNKKYRFNAHLDHDIIQLSDPGEDAIDKISHGEIINAISGLTPAYRTVLNLFVIDGFTHEEIALQLGISIGASKSNLARARRQLKEILFKQNKIMDY
jgi:RNA polymerase sigma-70 factor, ECF subfamily